MKTKGADETQRPTENQHLSCMSKGACTGSPDSRFPGLLGGWGAGTGQQTAAPAPMPVWNVDTGWEFLIPGKGVQILEVLPQRMIHVLDKCLFKERQGRRKRGRKERKAGTQNQPTCQSCGKTHEASGHWQNRDPGGGGKGQGTPLP